MDFTHVAHLTRAPGAVADRRAATRLAFSGALPDA